MEFRTPTPSDGYNRYNNRYDRYDRYDGNDRNYRSYRPQPDYLRDGASSSNYNYRKMNIDDRKRYMKITPEDYERNSTPRSPISRHRSVFEGDVHKSFYSVLNHNLSTAHLKKQESYPSDDKQRSFYDNIVHFLKRFCGITLYKDIVSEENVGEVSEFLEHCICVCVVGILAGKYLYDQDIGLDKTVRSSYTKLGLSSTHVKDITQRLFSTCSQAHLIKLPKTYKSDDRQNRSASCYPSSSSTSSRPESSRRQSTSRRSRSRSRSRSRERQSTTPVKDELSDTLKSDIAKNFFRTKEGKQVLTEAILNAQQQQSVAAAAAATAIPYQQQTSQSAAYTHQQPLPLPPQPQQQQQQQQQMQLPSSAEEYTMTYNSSSW